MKTATQLVLAVRQRSDTENSAFVSDTEVLDYVNQSAFELYDLLIGTYEAYEDIGSYNPYNANQYYFTVQSGSSYPLPIGIPGTPDFYKMYGVDIQMAGRWIALKRFNFNERNRFVPIALYTAPLGLAPVKYRILGNNLIFVPENQISGNQFRLWYAPRMSTLYFGNAASASIQGINYAATTSGSAGNNISLTYTSGALAGNEVVSITGSAINVQLQNGVSTSAQVAAAINSSTTALSLVVASLQSSTQLQTVYATTNLQGGVNDAELDGVSGWDEYVIVLSAIKVLIKEESDTTALERERLMLKERIENMASNRDIGTPDTVTDITAMQGFGSLYDGGMGFNESGGQ